MTENILGYSVYDGSLDGAVGEILAGVEEGRRGRYLACANPHSLQVARGDRTFHEALMAADILVPDGIGIVVASHVFGGRIRDRITGSDVFEAVNGAFSRAGGRRCFFLGSTEENLVNIERRMARDFPGLEVAGRFSPPFREDFTGEDNERMVEAVNAVRPDLLWVGMTAPKQEKWIYRNRERLEAGFIGAVGAVFDFYSGRVKRSHPWFLRHGLEWLPRLARKPAHLWKRNFVSSPGFMTRVLWERLRQ